jgi:hypothetical protein
LRKGLTVDALTILPSNIFIFPCLGSQRIEEAFGYPFWSKTWKEINPNFFSALKLQKIVMFLVLILIILVAGFNIVSTLIMTVILPLILFYVPTILGTSGFNVPQSLLDRLPPYLAQEIEGLGPLQSMIYIFAVMSALFVPCISTMAVLSRENGWRVAALVTLYTVLLGIGIGALMNLALS